VSVLIGSLRKESFSLKVAQALVAEAPASLECRARFFPPTGGSERGAKEVIARYDRDARSFGKGGETQLEELQSASAGDVGFWTGFQSAQVKMGDGSEPVSMKLRITELFRRIEGEWKMVHRHADPMAEPAKHNNRG